MHTDNILKEERSEDIAGYSTCNFFKAWMLMINKHIYIYKT